MTRYADSLLSGKDRDDDYDEDERRDKKRQAQLEADRHPTYVQKLNNAHAYDTKDNSGFSNASFSSERLVNDIKSHFNEGTALSTAHQKAAAQSLASLENTPYGKAARNFVGSLKAGTLNLSDEAIRTAGSLFASAPPPEIAMYTFLTRYRENEGDPLAYVKETEDMMKASGRMQGTAHAAVAKGREAAHSIRTKSYNELEYLTTDMSRSAFARPDKWIGDFCEYFIPSFLSMVIPSKGANAAQASFRAEAFITGAWLTKNGYESYYEKTKQELGKPGALTDDPEFKQYMKETNLSDEHAKTAYIEGRAREAGAKAAVVSFGSFLGSSGIRDILRETGGIKIVDVLQRFFQHQFVRINKEYALKSKRDKDKE